MSPATRLVTVEEYAHVPDPPGGRYELRHGVIKFTSFATKQHARVQRNVLGALFARCGSDYYFTMEFACRPLPEYELWAVDVGLTTTARWNATKNDAGLSGSPELAIEVLSPSNTEHEMQDRRETLFQGGCRQFWIVDTKSHAVTVWTHNGKNQIYRGTDSIPLEPYAAAPLPLSKIFAAID
jgi:Uma2 family endonuclease